MPKMLDWTAILVCVLSGILGGGGVVATVLVTKMKRKYEKEDKNDQILAEIEKLHERDKEMDARYRDCLLGISKVTLAVLIEHNPKDHKSILDESVYYFGELGGDSWAYDKVSQWADKEGVNIDYIDNLHERNIKGQINGKKPN